MNSKFRKLDKETWKISSPIDWGCASFEELVEKLANTFDIVCVRRNRFKNRNTPKYYRFIIQIKAPAKLVLAFHCSSFGYRAQYYFGEKNGEDANKYIIERLRPPMIEKINQMEKSTCKPDWVAKSLASRHTKIWIHQGSWLRNRERKIRNLEVERWKSHITDTDKTIAKKALWSTLVPHEERLEIKGGFIVLEGNNDTPNPKPDRSMQINKYGFT